MQCYLVNFMLACNGPRSYIQCIHTYSDTASLHLLLSQDVSTWLERNTYFVLHDRSNQQRGQSPDQSVSLSLTAAGHDG